MRRIVFAPSFDSELLEISISIEQRFGARAADEFEARIRPTAQILADPPDGGHETSRLSDATLRVRPESNQALYATSIGGATPLTVARASGYWVSTAIYGSYGLQLAAWRAKIATSSAAVAAAAAPSGAVVNMNAPAPPNPPDEFEQHVGNVLGAGKLGVASQLLNLRAQFHTAAAAQAHAMVAPTADELNARNQRFLDDAAKLLSASDFIAIFGVPPGTKVDLVVADPTRASPGTP